MTAISAISSVFGAGLSGLQVHSTVQQVAAHNIANVNTAGFVPQRAVLTESEGQAQLQAIITEHGSAGSARVTPNGADAAPFAAEGQIAAGTDIARSFVDMISSQHAFSASAKLISTQDQMLGTLFDLMA